MREGRRAAGRRARGFTLVETAVVLGVSAVLAAMGLFAFQSLRQRTSAATAVNDLVTRMQQLRMRAIAEAAPTVFVFDATGRRYWALLDRDGNFDLAKFDAANPTTPSGFSGTSPDVLLASDSLPGTVVWPSTAPSPLDPPFDTLPVASTTCPTSTGTHFCTFCCTDVAGARLGAIRFGADGVARLTGTTSEALRGGALSLRRTVGAGGILTVAVVARTGIVRWVER